MLGIDDQDIQTIATNLSADFIEERVPKTLGILTDIGPQSDRHAYSRYQEGQRDLERFDR
jgi:hypothetical protein